MRPRSAASLSRRSPRNPCRRSHSATWTFPGLDRELLPAGKWELWLSPSGITADGLRLDANADYRELGTVWGHFTMFGMREQDVAEIDALYEEILAS